MINGSRHTDESRRKISHANKIAGRKPPSRLGVKTSDEVRKKISASMIRNGNIPPSALGIKRSEEFKQKVRKNHSRYWTGKKQSPETIQKRVSKISGKKSVNWKGGVTTENVRIRTSVEYKSWIKKVFERDKYTCGKYGIIGGKLVAHHIRNFSEYPELRFEVRNGITLSEKAHKEFHKKYGRKNNTNDQLIEFLKS